MTSGDAAAIRAAIRGTAEDSGEAAASDAAASGGGTPGDGTSDSGSSRRKPNRGKQASRGQRRVAAAVRARAAETTTGAE